MRIVLIQPPFEDFFATPIRFYPLGLTYVAETLRQCGHEVTVLDTLTPLRKRTITLPSSFAPLRQHLKETPHFFRHYYRFGKEDHAILQEIAALRPHAVGLSAQFTAYYKNVHELAGKIKNELGLFVFIGGNHATALAEEIRQRSPAIDAIVKGPVENGLAEVLQRLDAASTFKGLDWRALQPAHDLLTYQDYQIGKRNYASLICSRGCPVGCEFCSVQNMFGRRIEYRSIESILAEMHYLYDQHQVRIFNFEDDNLTCHRTWFKSFMAALLKEARFKDIELTAMNGICYPTLDEELLSLMWQAGFRRLNLSLVTQDPHLRRAYQRPGTDQDLQPVIRAAQNLGFQITVYLIIGLPEQTYEEVKATIDHLLDLNVLVGPSVFYLPPASPLLKRLHIERKILSDWNLYRSAAFAIETEHLSRQQLVELFIYARGENLSRAGRE